MELDIIKLQTTWNDAAGSLNNNFAKIQQAINTGSGGGSGVVGGGIYEIKYDFLNGNPLSEEDIAFNAEVFDKLSRNEVSALYIVVYDGIEVRHHFVADSFYYTPSVDGEGDSGLLLNFTAETLSLMGLPQRVIQIGSDGSAEEIPLSGSGMTFVHLSKPDDIATFYSNNPETSFLNTLIVDDIDNAVNPLVGRIVDASSGYITYSCSNGDVRRVTFNSDYTIKKRGLIEGVIYLGDNLTDFQKQANLAYATAMKDLNDYDYSNGNKKRVGVVVYYNGDFYNALIFNKSGIVILVGGSELQEWIIDEAGNTTLGVSINIGGADIDTSKFATTAQLQELDNILSDEIDGLKDSKQNVIEDLAAIRSGAALGATALQEHQDISHLATKTEVEAKYTKPSSGIPKSDLVSEVQESLGKADTAIQNVKTINGESILGEGDIEIKANVDTSNLATKEELESLTNEMIANEEVHAAAYNDLDSRLKDVGSLISGVAVTKEEFQEGIQSVTNEMIANEEVTATALNDLNKRVNAISENVSGETATKVELQDAVTSLTNIILENEEVHAAALNDLNERIENTGGGGSYDDTEIRNELSRKADVDGVYPEMTVGMTRDMLGVGEGDEGEFLFRPTDGEGSIKDGFASIERIEGNSVVWNQMYSAESFEESGVSMTFANGEIKISGVYSGSNTFVNLYNFLLNFKANYIAGHKYLLLDAFTDSKVLFIYIYGGLGSPAALDSDGFFTATSGGRMENAYIRVAVTQGETIDIRLKPRLFDLTRMFGEGNEPLTIDEFYARLPKGIDINAYNEGEVVNMNVEGIKSVGFNAWDEEWENGVLTSNGDNAENGSFIRSKNYIPVIGGATYYYSCRKEFYNNYIVINYYDNNLAPIGQSVSIGQFNVPKDCAYLRFYVNDTYGSIYNNDICINLVHTGYRNGEYEPYVSDEIALPIADYFPNGMNSIGNVKDELTATEAIQRIGVVDMGTLDWNYSQGVVITWISDMKGIAERNTALISKYSASSSPYGENMYNNVEDKVYKTNGGAVGGVTSLAISDSSYTDAASFKAAMSGVMLYYELAEPIVTSIDKPLDLDYQVWDFGTEEAIAEGKTTPLKASIIYEFNARDTIRANKLALKNKADKTYVDEAIAQAITLTLNTEV